VTPCTSVSDTKCTSVSDTKRAFKCTSVSDTKRALEPGVFAGEVWKPLQKGAAFVRILYLDERRP
jgi:hypothetical protein